MTELIYNQSLTQFINNNEVLRNKEFGYFIGCLHLHSLELANERYVWENYVIAIGATNLHIYRKDKKNYVKFENKFDTRCITVTENHFCGYFEDMILNNDNWIMKWHLEDYHMYHPEFKKKIFTFLCCLKRQEIITGNKYVYKVPKYILFNIFERSVHVIF